MTDVCVPGSRRDRFRGALMGLAVGDALGAPLEGLRPGQFSPLTDMVGSGRFGLQPGQWTDDTSMALCLAAGLTECGEFNPRDQIERYVRWLREGYLSSIGVAFGIGRTTYRALATYVPGSDPYVGPTVTGSAGNGSIMRLAPVPMFFFDTPAQAIEKSAACSRTTHQARAVIDGCRLFGALLIGGLQGIRVRRLPRPTMFQPAFLLSGTNGALRSVKSRRGVSFDENRPK